MINKTDFFVGLREIYMGNSEGEDHKLKQVLSILTINGVDKIEDKSIFFNNLIYNVLSISNYDDNFYITQ